MLYTLITGASSGIGKALAFECAGNGMNVLLVALPGEDLQAVTDEIRSTYKVKADCLGVDLSDPKSCYQVCKWVSNNNYKVNVLINNVGLGSKGRFEDIPTDFYYTQLNLNVTTTCLLTRLFIPHLKKQQGNAHILNVGSMGGFFFIPDKTVYSATKAFIYSFSRSLRLELIDTKIKVSVLCPGGTDTNANTVACNQKLKGIAKKSILTSEQVAKEALSQMLKGKAVIIPGFYNKFYYSISRVVPDFVRNYFVANVFKRLHKQNY